MTRRQRYSYYKTRELSTCELIWKIIESNRLSKEQLHDDITRNETRCAEKQRSGKEKMEEEERMSWLYRTKISVSLFPSRLENGNTIIEYQWSYLFVILVRTYSPVTQFRKLNVFGASLLSKRFIIPLRLPLATGIIEFSFLIVGNFSKWTIQCWITNARGTIIDPRPFR